MSNTKAKKHLIIERTERHLAVIRGFQVTLLFTMSLYDGIAGDRFDFPMPCYLLMVSAILGLDVPKMFKYIFGKGN